MSITEFIKGKYFAKIITRAPQSRGNPVMGYMQDRYTCNPILICTHCLDSSLQCVAFKGALRSARPASSSYHGSLCFTSGKKVLQHCSGSHFLKGKSYCKCVGHSAILKFLQLSLGCNWYWLTSSISLIEYLTLNSHCFCCLGYFVKLTWTILPSGV